MKDYFWLVSGQFSVLSTLQAFPRQLQEQRTLIPKVILAFKLNHGNCVPFCLFPDDCSQSKYSDSSVPCKDPAQENEITNSLASGLIDREKPVSKIQHKHS